MSQERLSQQEDRSIVGLVIDSMVYPRSAFAEIVRRRLLGVGIGIGVVVSVLNTIVNLVDFCIRGKGTLWALAGNNPVSALGWWMINAWLVFLVSRALGGKGTFRDVWVVLLWVFLPAGVSAVAGIALGPRAGAIDAVTMVWGIVIAIIAVSAAQRISGWRSFVSLAVAGTVWVLPLLLVALLFRTVLVRCGLHPITWTGYSVAGSIFVSLVAAVGLIVAGYRAEDISVRLRVLIKLIGVASFLIALNTIGFLGWLNPYKLVADAVAAYNSSEPDARLAAANFRRVQEYFPDDGTIALAVGHSLALAGDYKGALRQYEDVKRRLPNYRGAASGAIGNVYLMQGDFRRGSNVFPTRWKTPPAEDLARMALVQLHVKDRKGAVTQAERAIDLGDKTALPQVVLAQALLATKQDEKAAVAIKKVQEIDPDLAKRIEGRPGGWKNAIRALSPKDLRLPLDPVTAKRS